MRIVTRPDFDGIVCSVLLYEAEDIREPINWVEPGDVQRGLADIRENDILANLPYDHRCSLWFDHHYSNKIEKLFNGAFNTAPSAAGVVFDYYTDRLRNDYRELVRAADKIDSADLTMDEVLYPENEPYILLSMTISNQNDEDEPYWNRLIDLLREQNITDVMNDPEVKIRCRKVVLENREYKKFLKKYTQLKKHLAITDFRSLDNAPNGNRFLVYSLFPDSVVHMKIRRHPRDREKIAINIGHSIFNRNCNVNLGEMLSKYEGGGHPGAGASTFHVSRADKYIPEIISILLKN